jgi:hypothetical protein
MIIVVGSKVSWKCTNHLRQHEECDENGVFANLEKVLEDGVGFGNT